MTDEAKPDESKKTGEEEVKAEEKAADTTTTTEAEGAAAAPDSKDGAAADAKKGGDDAVAAPTPAAAAGEQKGGGGGKGGGGKGGGRNNNKKDEVPIEELFDLSKPIPKVDRPFKAEHDKTLQALDDAIEDLKKERTQVQKDLDNSMLNPESKKALQDTRTELNGLKSQKGKLIHEKKEMRTKLDALKNQTDKIIKEKKDARSNVKFNTLKEIEDEIAKLKKRQETTSMSLNDEKKLLKEIDSLQASKKHLVDLKDKDVAMEGTKEQRKSLGAMITAKDKEIDEVSKKIDGIMETLNIINSKDSTKKDGLQALFKKRDELRAKIGEKLKEKDALRDAFREKSNAFHNYQRAIRAQQKIQYEEEKKKREEERAEYLAKLEEEEAKKIPYEEEQHLCDFLASYLERTYLNKAEENGGDNNATKKDVVEVKEDPFAGLKPVSKKDEDEYFGKGKGKKKRTRAPKKQDMPGPFTLSVDSFEQFGLLDLSPPKKVEEVENSVKELREKKEWYKQQPRGSVPTITEKRKQNEKEVAKFRRNTDGPGDATAAAANSKNKKKGGFSLSSEDFVPLGGGEGKSEPSAAASSPLISSWGKTSPGAASAAVVEPTPGEASA